KPPCLGGARCGSGAGKRSSAVHTGCPARCGGTGCPRRALRAAGRRRSGGGAAASGRAGACAASGSCPCTPYPRDRGRRLRRGPAPAGPGCRAGCSALGTAPAAPAKPAPFAPPGPRPPGGAALRKRFAPSRLHLISAAVICYYAPCRYHSVRGARPFCPGRLALRRTWAPGGAAGRGGALVDVSIRMARPREAGVVHRILMEAYAPYRGKVVPPLKVFESTPASIAVDIRTRRHAHALAFIGTTPVGTVRCTPGRNGQGERRWTLSRLAVLPEY